MEENILLFQSTLGLLDAIKNLKDNDQRYILSWSYSFSQLENLNKFLHTPEEKIAYFNQRFGEFNLRIPERRKGEYNILSSLGNYGIYNSIYVLFRLLSFEQNVSTFLFTSREIIINKISEILKSVLLENREFSILKKYLELVRDTLDSDEVKKLFVERSILFNLDFSLAGKRNQRQLDELCRFGQQNIEPIREQFNAFCWLSLRNLLKEYLNLLTRVNENE